MKLLVVILNYNVTELTIDCLRSLAPQIGDVPGMKVAICENGSGGNAEQRLRDAVTTNGWTSWADVTAVSPNRGFTGGNNIVLRAALCAKEPPKYFLLLNADTVVRTGAVKALVEFMDAHPNVGIAGSRLEWPDGRAQGSPFEFQTIATELSRGLRLNFVSRFFRKAPEQSTPQSACAVDWVAGASMIIRREVIDDIGPLDEGLYTYFDDIDFCLNAKRAGWETWFVPQSRVVHLEGESTGIKACSAKRRPAYWFEARRRYFLKNHGPLYAAGADLAFITGFTLWRIRRVLQRKTDMDPPKFLLDSLRHSVFLTGFALRDVKNPALPEGTVPHTARGPRCAERDA